MTIHEKTYYVAACDSCGVEHDGGEYSAWADAEVAYEAATSGDWGRWKKQDDGRLFCWDCRFQPGGDSFEPEESTAPEEEKPISDVEQRERWARADHNDFA